MKKLLIMSAALALLVGCSDKTKPSNDVTQYVDPFIGTINNGHTFPGATYPFGMIQVSPDTGINEWRYCSGYEYLDSTMYGFSQTHLNGTGCPDLADILLLPYSGDTVIVTAPFDKASEKAVPGYYAVDFPKYGVKAEMTATAHTAMHKYTYNAENPRLLVDLQHGQTFNENGYKSHVLDANVNIESDKVISGHSTLKNWVERELFYVIEFDRPFKIEKELEMLPEEKGKRYVLSFDIPKGEELKIKVAVSTVSVDGAKNNMAVENSKWDFDAVKKATYNTWNDLLGRVEIEGTEAQKESFYTSMYHLYIQPNNIADVDGQYRGADNQVKTAKDSVYYSTMSLWDTFRAAHPLYTILNPEKVDGFVNTMLDHFDAQGHLPIWTLWGKENFCMIGNHSIPVIVDAYLKGFDGFDAERAYNAIKTTSTVNNPKTKWDLINKYGYLPFDLEPEESVSRTLELGYDDYCASLMAQALGKTEDAAFFANRAGFYKNLYDPSTGLMRGKDSKGQWRTPFDAFKLSHAGTSGGDFTEGNAWQYTWHVMQDIPGLAELMGGPDKFMDKIDSLFVVESHAENTGFVLDVTGLIGQYAQGNEPSHHVAYIYSYLGRPWRTEELIREINDKFYINKPDGLCGNDDCGQMSAWYMFSSMGFYPMNPTGGEFVLGAPQMPKITINLKDGKTFTVIAENLSDANKYVQSVSLNGVPLNARTINYKDIMNGGTLTFVMGPEKKI